MTLDPFPFPPQSGAGGAGKKEGAAAGGKREGGVTSADAPKGRVESDDIEVVLSSPGKHPPAKERVVEKSPVRASAEMEVDGEGDDGVAIVKRTPAKASGKRKRKAGDSDSEGEGGMGTPRVTASGAEARSTPKSSAKKPPTKKRTPAKKETTYLDPLVGPEAVECTKKAMGRLPSVDNVNFTVQEKSLANNWNQGDRAPANPGSKEPPRGHQDCLVGLTFVISGALESLHRPEAEALIKQHGGKVTGSVSGKTSFLLVGEDTGNRKFEAARDKGTTIIDEDGLFSLIKASSHLAKEQPGSSPAPLPVAVLPSKPVGGASSAPPAPRQEGAGPSRTHDTPGSRGKVAAGELWVEKWKPKAVSDLVGNNALVATLRGFLEQWDDIHLRGRAPRAIQGAGQRKNDMSKKAVLLSGPPGIGKSSSAAIVARAVGFSVVEVNASDTRNKSDTNVRAGVNNKLSNMVRELTTNTAVNGKRTCIVMDEVDGMSAGDRGGIADLCKLIPKSKIPIICICNDKYAQKLKSLKNHTLMLDYRKPAKPAVIKRLLRICQAEGLRTNEASLDMLCEMANGDIRMILGQLQMIRLRSNSLSYEDLKGKAAFHKDASISPFHACDRLLSEAPTTSGLSFADSMDLMMSDLDLIPLLIQENYVSHKPFIAGSARQHMQCIAKSAEALSVGDLVNTSIRKRQNWHLMPFSSVMSGVYPCVYSRGQRQMFGYPGEQNFPRFTAWMGQNSSAGKQRRLLADLHTRMTAGGAFTADSQALRRDYLPFFRKELLRPLQEQGQEGIDEMIGGMREYCLVREDFEFVTDITKFKTKDAWGEDPLKGVETKVKSAFTRRFNKSGGRAKIGTMVEDAKRGSKKKRPMGEGEVLLTEDADLIAEAQQGDGDEDGDEEVNVGALAGVDFQPAAQKKGKGAGASKKGAAKGGGKK